MKTERYFSFGEDLPQDPEDAIWASAIEEVRGVYPEYDELDEDEQAEFIEESEPFIEHEREIRTGLMQTINGLIGRYPRIANTITLAGLAFAISVLAGEGDRGKPDDFTAEIIAPIVLPEVQRPKVEIKAPSLDRQKTIVELEAEVGSDPIYWITNLESVQSPEERAEVAGLPNKIVVGGFERLGMPNGAVRDIVEKTLPQGFNRNLNTLDYEDREILMQAVYGPKVTAASGETAHVDRQERKIVFSRGVKNESWQSIAHHVLPHEMFHLQDWLSNSLLTIDERIDLYKKVVDRVKSPDRFKSRYVEKIFNDDEKVELSQKATEYFADIGAAYVSHDYFLLPQADKEIIRDLIAKVDPEFDREKALQTRDGLVEATQKTAPRPAK